MVSLAPPPIPTQRWCAWRTSAFAPLFLHILPRYDHIVTPKSYNSRLARDQLRNNPVRSQLADAISGLSMQTEATHILIDDLGGTHDDDIEAAATNAFDIGQKTMSSPPATP